MSFEANIRFEIVGYPHENTVFAGFCHRDIVSSVLRTRRRTPERGSTGVSSAVEGSIALHLDCASFARTPAVPLSRYIVRKKKKNVIIYADIPPRLFLLFTPLLL